MILDPWFGKAAVLAGIVAMVAIRAPHGQRSRKAKVARSYKGPLEVALLTIVWLGFFVPMLWVWKPIFAFADYPLRVVPYVAGIGFLAAGLWLLHRTHADLGTNWSVTLEVRESHRLVTDGIYRRLRHPMYTAFFLYSIGQALALPNWIAGPSYLVAFGLLFALRLRPEERMMRERFGADYDAYVARTDRVLHGVW
jgi:protein-S-isoprenylcysteine O-methyltransferase Ste14